VPAIDFFISYNHHDEEWATWIAYTLEQAGFTSVIQAWDFRPGSNFVVEMDRAAKEAERTIAVLSPHYLSSGFTPSEWAAAFSSDPKGTKRALIPVRVRECDISGLLGQIVYIDLVGLDDAAATAKLLAGIEPGRAKPLTRPVFLGAATRAGAPGSSRGADASTELHWRVLPEPLAVTWRSEGRQGFYGPTMLEVHIVPASPIRIEARRLAQLSDELISVGRLHGLFSTSQAVTATLLAESVTVAVETGQDNQAGLMVTRTGQRSAWVKLPHDMMGSVLDPGEASTRVSAILDLLLGLDLPSTDEAGFAIGVGPVGMMIVGDASVVGRRSSASLPMTGLPDMRVGADDALPLSSVRNASSEIAEELMARLIAGLPH
jgi:hypothetical protein